jgi:predicted nucleic acid-binding Zn ribbon protein
MGSYSIGEAISLLFEKSGWKSRAHEVRLRQEWEAIMGKHIARYTMDIHLEKGVLTIHTSQPALKQELVYGKTQAIARINEHFGEMVVKDIIVK